MNIRYLACFLILGGSLGMPASISAKIIAIYTQPGEPLPLEEVRALAKSLRENPGYSTGAKFGVKISDSSVLSPLFSVPSGVSAYFWSDHKYRRAGYKMKGKHAHYEADLLPKGSVGEIADVQSVPPLSSTVATELIGVAMASRGIQLRYTISNPGVVVLEVFGAKGSRLGQWKWEEVAAGEYQRTFDLHYAPPGIVFVRWRHGGVQVVQKIGGVWSLNR